MDDAGALRAELADQLLGDGVLHEPRWLKAFREVPRHEFLPRFYRRRPDGDWEAVTSEHPDWLGLVYSDRVWVTQFDGDDAVTGGTPTCSSSMPTIMAIMLEALDVRPGHRVLEVGTGTGYNAALLCHAVDSENVTTVDVDPNLSRRARERLHRNGFQPACETGDGALGHPGRAPFDRLLATCSVATVPPAWLEQTRPGGLVVTTLHRPIGAGLVRITSNGDGTGEGRVLGEDGRFMPLRAHARLPALAGTGAFDRRTTTLRFRTVADPSSPFEFFAGTALPGVAAGRDRLAHPDGSWVHHHGSHVDQGGPRRLWDLAENAVAEWHDLGEPRRHDFGVAIAPDGQFLTLGDLRWRL
ncbi:methyltransferase domain-containing protein [Lentzea jiangxiensis]|uniref:Protein-L-isoaspartate O-methyltransferase n=1 Tax=Lentzea jiangxiensis TaxID=641025 RepID=A0A1H0DNP2_9PSEU|nr:methyltransferase domain-containing protein [Lentzea jiangxiensis]SDN71764.1 protein-L-isoaspartate(D-aspartate) O-methyltransferase [Lentzea jiangxiensis]